MSFIKNALNKLNFSYKKVSNKLYGKNLSDLLTKQKLYKLSNQKTNWNNVISIDETYIYLNSKPNYGWSKKGTRIFNYQKSNPIKYSIIMAISNKKIIGYQIYKSNINFHLFYNFLIGLSFKFTNKIFLMDNVSFHKNNKLRLMAEYFDNKIMFIPPYSPQFNPIEEVFSVLKNNLRRTPITDLNDISKIIKSLNKLQISKFYNNMLKYLKL